MIKIVAEISGNHGGNLEKARELIREAAEAGCQYAKFQYYRPEDMPDRYEGDNLAMYRKLAVPDEWLPYLFNTARHVGVGLFASVFSVRAVLELLKYDVPYIKLASPESTQLTTKIYEEIAQIVHQSMARLIVSAHEKNYNQMRALNPHRILFCPSGHPPIIDFPQKQDYYFGWYHGFSDHTSGIAAPLWFVAQHKTQIVEKHLKLDNDCVDAAFSADPATMRQFCRIANG